MHVRMDHHHIYRLALKDEKPEKETDVEDREKQCGIFDACCKKKNKRRTAGTKGMTCIY